MTKTGDDRQDADLVHRYLLERLVRRDPEAPFARFPEEGTEWTRRRALEEIDRAAAGLAELEVGKGDVVALLHPNGSRYLAFFLAALSLGAITAPLNGAYRGPILRHVLGRAKPKVLVITGADVERLADLDLEPMHVIVTDGIPADGDRLPDRHHRLHDLSFLPPAGTGLPAVEPIRFWDPYAVVFTSGTTGPSKGVLSPYGQIHAVLKDNFLQWLHEDDVLLLDAPIFHISGLLMVYSALWTGAPLIVYAKFSGSAFLDRVRRDGVTVATVSAQEALFTQPERPDDADNTLRLVLIGRHSTLWKTRYDVERTFTFYNMSEISSPLQLPPEPANPLSVGRPRPGVDLRIVDEFDLEVLEGEIGELIVRTDRPWEMNLGYINDPRATADAWRNGWFHTGDSFRVDVDSGEYLFVDRIKDSIRRRGENISSFEVEQQVLTHELVQECAVVSVPGDLPGDEEVKAVVVLSPDSVLEPGELIEHLTPRLPHFMLPRYVEVLPGLPRTETGKVRKVELRTSGITATTWDRTHAD